MEQFLMQTYTIALPIVLTALMGYIVLFAEKSEERQGRKQQRYYAASAGTVD